MKKLLLLLMFYSGIVNAQVMPFGMLHRNEVATISYRDTETVVVEVTSVTGRIWMDRNLGATQVATGSTDQAAYGHLYQWGRGADEHQITNSPTTGVLSPSDTPGNKNFIINTVTPFDWRSSLNNNLWQGADGTNNPCPSGFRLPTEEEWQAERAIWGDDPAASAFTSPLKLTKAGYRENSGGSLNNVNSRGFYYSSTTNGTVVRYIRFNNSVAQILNAARSSGFTVRCIKPYTPTLPSAPTNVKAVAGDKTAEVTFDAPTNNGGSAITSYTATSFPEGLSSTLEQAAVGTITVSGLTNGEEYTFFVTATNAKGESEQSDRSAGVTPATLPSAPTNVKAVAGDKTAEVTFDAPTNNGGSAITSYTATSFPEGLSSTLEQAAVGTITVSGLTNGEEYTFFVTATNAKGESEQSDRSAGVTPATLPSAPTNVKAVAGDKTAEVTFDAPTNNGGSAITSYTATSFPEGLSSTLEQAAVGTITVSGLTNGEEYTFFVTATNAKGESEQSDRSAGVTPATLPSAPTNVKAVAGDKTAEVTFDAPTNNGGSAITSYTATSFPEGLSSTLEQAAVGTITVSGLTNGEEYTFFVTATNAKGESEQSDRSAGVTPATLPSAPTNVKAVAGDKTAEVTFDAPTNNGGSAITSYTATSFPEGLSSTLEQAAVGTITVSGLTNGEEYTFFVTATNAKGESEQSDRSAGVTPATLPSAPTNVKAVAGDKTAEVTFDAPTNNGGSAITSYTATSFPEGLSSTLEQAAVGTITVSGLTNGEEYTFFVTATNAKGESEQSDRSAGVTPAVALKIGDFYQGGIVFYIASAPTDLNSDSVLDRGLVCAVEDQGKIRWNKDSSSRIDVLDARLADISAGSSNTNAIIAAQGGTPTTYAAGLAKAYNGGGFTDWFLPSIEGLNEMYKHQDIINTKSEENSGAVFESYFTWSSTQNSYNQAFQIWFGLGACKTCGECKQKIRTIPIMCVLLELLISSTGTPSTAADAPTMVTAAAGDTLITVTFEAPISNGGFAITRYTATSSQGEKTDSVTQSGSGTINVSGLTNRISYTFRDTASHE